MTPLCVCVSMFHCTSRANAMAINCADRNALHFNNTRQYLPHPKPPITKMKRVFSRWCVAIIFSVSAHLTPKNRFHFHFVSVPREIVIHIARAPLPSDPKFSRPTRDFALSLFCTLLVACIFYSKCIQNGQN